MKRSAALVIFFALASVAGAAPSDILEDIQLVLDGTTVEVICLDASLTWASRQLPPEEGGPMGIFGIYVPDDAMTPAVGPPLNSYPAAGDMRAITQWTGYNGVDTVVFAGLGPPVQTGLWFDFQITGATGQVTFDIWVADASGGYDEEAGPVGQLTTVPEPATIALLALGGVVVLRKRNKPLMLSKETGR